jgi:hypothetical protein
MRVLGGGGLTTPGTVGSLKASGSFPSAESGVPVISGANPTAWTGVGLNGDQADQGNTTHAFAVCAPAGGLPDVDVVNARVPGPATGSTPAQVTVSCPPGSVLLSGGGFISDDFAIAGSQGDHLTGSFPSDAGGTPVAAGAAGSWTVLSHSGGMPSGALTTTDAWALCAAVTPAPSDTGSAPPGSPVTAAPPKPAASAPVGIASRAQIAAALRSRIAPTGRGARIGSILAHGGYSMRLSPPEPGTAVVSWYGGNRGQLLARGQARFVSARAVAFTVRLKPAGRHALKGARRVRLTIRAGFTPVGRATVTLSRTVVLVR